MDKTTKSTVQSTERNYEDIADVRIPIGQLSRKILNQTARYSLLDVAESIVLKGVGNVLNLETELRSKPARAWAPVVKFGDLTLIDRSEIENYRSVHNLMRHAIQARKDRPLSVAVFWPPGCGKSFSVEQLALSAGVKHEHFRSVNMVKISSDVELRQEFDKLDDIEKKSGFSPVMLFDEFDCTFQDSPFGWLKYFLPLMEDRRSALPADVEKGNPVLFFSGGTSFTYEQFSRRHQLAGSADAFAFLLMNTTAAT